MKYRIKEVALPDNHGEVYIQYKSAWGFWRTIWRRMFVADDRDYALLCAEEVKDHLEIEI